MLLFFVVIDAILDGLSVVFLDVDETVLGLFATLSVLDVDVDGFFKGLNYE